MMDAVTGLMDAHGFMDALIDCSLHYHESGQDYGLVLFANENHYRIIDTYGSDFSDQVLRKMSEVLLDITGGSSSLSRPRESVFALLAYVDDLEILKARETEIREALNAITSVDGKPVTIRMKSSASLRSVESCSDESLYALTLSKLGE
jgi:GGDEF domain-containing protein